MRVLHAPKTPGDRMADIIGLRVAAPWAHDGLSLGDITIERNHTRPSLIYYVTKLSKRAFLAAEGVAWFLERDCRNVYPNSSIEVERGYIHHQFSWVALTGDFVHEIVQGIVEMAEIEASGEVPFWIKPLINVEFRLLRAFYDPNIPLLRNAPVDGARLMLEPYRHVAWYVANGVYPVTDESS